MAVLIRAATIDDCASIARVQVDSYRTAYAGILPQAYLDHFTYEEQTQDWRDLLSSGSHDILLVAQPDSGEIAGYALGRSGGDIQPFESELVALHVRRSHQRQGLGQQLFTVCAQQLWHKGCTSMMLWVLAQNPARAFYEHLGGRLIGTRQVDLGAGDVVATEVAYGWVNIEKIGTPMKN